MTIEKDLTRIADALDVLVKYMTHDKPVPASLPVPAFDTSRPAGVVAAPAVTPVAPAAPTPVAAPVVVEGAAPFADAKGLMEYCMGKYRDLGPVKGSMIQNALVELGVANLSSLKVDQYAAFYAKVEAIPAN
jgi:hypothetical protein